MYSFRTTGFNGYAVQYSPFFDSRLACAASANFGLVGNGRLYVLGLTPTGIVVEKWFDTQDGLFDCAWSEIHENQIVTATGDGSIKLFDITLNVRHMTISCRRELTVLRIIPYKAGGNIREKCSQQTGISLKKTRSAHPAGTV
jgi:hypothetical protein